MTNKTCLQLLISHVLPQLLCYPLQVFEADLASLVIIKQSECLQNLLLQAYKQLNSALLDSSSES